MSTVEMKEVKLEDDHLPDDIGSLVSDSFSSFSFGDMNGSSNASDADSSSWMQKIDVSNFKQLTTTVDEDEQDEVKQKYIKLEVENADELNERSGAQRAETPQAAVLLDHGNYTSMDTKFAVKSMEDVVPMTILPPATVHQQQPQFPSPVDSVMQSPSCTVHITDEFSPMVAGGCARTNDYPATVAPPTNVMRQPTSRAQASAPQSTTTVFLTADGSPIINGRAFPKPIYSYSCLIALALKNSKTRRLTVAEIYNFMCENFPYFRTAPAGWKNSVRHNLSLNKCFEKIEIEAPGGHGRKSCLWTLNPNKVNKMDQEIRKWREKDHQGVLDSLQHSDELESIEKGTKGMPTESASYAAFPCVDAHGRTVANSQMLVVRSNTMPPQPPYANSAGSFGGSGRGVPQQLHMNQRSSSWTSAAAPKVPRLLSHHPRFVARRQSPPQQRHSDPSYHTPMAAGRQQQQQQLNLQQTSPFSQTPPYSPTMQTPMSVASLPAPSCSEVWATRPSVEQATPVKQNGPTSDPSNLSNPMYNYSPYALHKLTAPPIQGVSPSHGLFSAYQSAPAAYQSSPCKLLDPNFGGSPLRPANAYQTGALGHYEATQSALHNNSLLQTALQQQSPNCKGQTTVVQQSLHQPSNTITLQSL